jgi:ketosteroid isomerase-like protein
MHRFRVLIWLAVLVLGGGCTPSRTPQALQDELLEADRAFSRLSEENGQAAAFLEYMADDGVLYPFQGEPVWGRDDYRELIQAVGSQDPGASLVWEPLVADVSRSGELGYTLGRYTASSSQADGSVSVRRGYYATIWKKQADGNWRFVFDGGNQLPPEPEGKREEK